MLTIERGGSLCSCGLQGAHRGNAPAHPRSLDPDAVKQLTSSKRIDITSSKALSPDRVLRSPGTRTNLRAATTVNGR